MTREKATTYFDAARSAVIAGQSYKALDTLLRVLDTALKTPNWLTQDDFGRVISTFPAKQPGDSVLILLHFLGASLFQLTSSKVYLRQQRLCNHPISSPVCIVAGGSGGLAQQNFQKWRELLKDVFRDYAGCIISGGTTAGIPGLLGTVSGEITQKKFRLLGYCPEKLPATARLAANYDRILRTRAMDFSVLEPLHYWNDILSSGISVSSVRLLGIDGGELSAFEYRLALALGARVGLIKGSGRAVDRLSRDPFWQNHECLQFISPKPAAILHFLNKKY